MRKLILILISCLCFSAFSQTNTNQREQERISKNGIKTITQYSHKFIKGEPSPKGDMISKSFYDNQGNLIEKINYSRKGEETLKTKYKYNQRGEKIEFTSYDVNAKSSLKQSFVYRNGNKVSETINEEIIEGTNTINIDFLIKYRYINDKISSITKINQATFEKTNIWKYSYSGNKTTVEELDGKSNLIKKTESFYNSKNELIKEIQTYPRRKDNNGAILSLTQIFKYNDKGQNIETTKLTGDEITEKITLKYDNSNNVTEIEKEVPNKTPYVENFYEYDKKDNLKRESWYEGDPQKYSKKTMKYNSKDILLETKYLYAKYNYQVMYTYEYTFY